MRIVNKFSSLANNPQRGIGHMLGFSVRKSRGWGFPQLAPIAYSAILIVYLYLPLAARAQSGPISPPASPESKSRKTAATLRADQTFTLVGAGDIATCKHLQGAEATAKLIEQIPGTVFAAGDLAYEGGTPTEFKDCYDPTWGKFKDRTKPALGNHDYGGPTADGYFQYWGGQAGPEGKGFYSYNFGRWHIVVLN